MLPTMTVPTDISDLLVAECMNRPVAYKELQWLCDHVGARTSGAESGKKAEEWAHGLFTKWGLENVHYEDVPVTVWGRGPLDVIALEPAGWKLTAMAHGNAPQKVDAVLEVLDLGHAEKSDFERVGGAARGKAVLCDEGVAEGHRALHRTEKLKLAIEAGAQALMIYSSASGGLPRTGVCFYGEAPIPSMGISQEDGERLKRLIAGGARPKVRISMRNTFGTGVGRNVIGEIVGTGEGRGSQVAGRGGTEGQEDGGTEGRRDEEGRRLAVSGSRSGGEVGTEGRGAQEVVLAGGHLDCWDVATGATDNGLGSAIVLQMAHALKALGKRPRRTLRFALWAAEEIGLCGSRAYVKAHGDELDRIAGVLNFDMTGDPYGFWCPGRKDRHPMLQGLAEQLAGLGMKDDYDHKAGLHSDHQPFMLAGVPVIGLMANLHGQGGHYYHSVGDTFEKVDLPSLCRAATVGTHTMWAVANSEERPFARLSRDEIEAMIDEADLREALAAEG